ncbi:hypothetical protein DOY81_013840, partial [Sarcophaga bullata]
NFIRPTLNPLHVYLESINGQMLMKWFISSLQNNCNHLSEQDISMLTLQYCNNLINVGVLKQISEKNIGNIQVSFALKNFSMMNLNRVGLANIPKYKHVLPQKSQWHVQLDDTLTLGEYI